jgi:hypothetical protein
VQFSETGFEVRGCTSTSTYIVQLDELPCSCGMFWEMQFSSEHAAASISKVGTDPLRFLHNMYLVQNLQALYNGAIIPVDLTQVLSNTSTIPPIIAKKAGRPKATRIRSRGEGCSNESVCCTKCGARGHNKRTCERRGSRQLATDVSKRPSAPSACLEQSTLDLRNTSSNANGMVSGGRIRKRRRLVCEKCGSNRYHKKNAFPLTRSYSGKSKSSVHWPRFPERKSILLYI